MTQAISRLLFSGTLTVYFDTGLGERDPNDTTQQVFPASRQAFVKAGWSTIRSSLADIAKQNRTFPANAAAVVMTRPTNDLTDAEIAVIDRYLKRGGALFLMADVLFSDNPFLKAERRIQYLSVGQLTACAPSTLRWLIRQPAGKQRST